MDATAVEEVGIGDVLSELRRAAGLLRNLQAGAVEGVVEPLEAAARHLGDIERRTRAGTMTAEQRAWMRGELGLVKKELNRVRALVAAAGQFYEGLGQLLAAAGDAAVYDPRGEIRTAGDAPRWRVEG